MSRPSTTPSFATNTNYSTGPAVGTPTKVAPSAPLLADGYKPGDEPGAQNWNYEINLICQWVSWLAAGILDGNWEFTGNVTLDNDLTIAVNKSIRVSGTGTYKRGTKIRPFAGIGTPTGSGGYRAVGAAFAGHWVGSANNDQLIIPVVVNQDETITRIDLSVYTDNVASLSVALYRQSDPFVSPTAVSETKTSTTGAGANTQVLSITHDSGGVTALAEAVNGTAWYWLQITQTGAGGPVVGGGFLFTTVP